MFALRPCVQEYRSDIHLPCMQIRECEKNKMRQSIRIHRSIRMNDAMTTPVKIPLMSKTEYDSLIKRQHVARIAFAAADHPYIAPFIYVFDGKYLYFLSTRYGRKIEYFKRNPKVSVEIEEYTPDLSAFTFVSLQGNLEEVQDAAKKKEVRNLFIEMIRKKGLSLRVLSALGHSPGEPVEALAREERSMVWKLVGVKDIVALKNG